MTLFNTQAVLVAAHPVDVEFDTSASLETLLAAVNAETHALAIRFPSLSDGRGYSLAARLRQAGYAGRLRACGALYVEQYADLIAVGFDEFAPEEAIMLRQPLPLWHAVLHEQSLTYQSHAGEKRSILAARAQVKP
jgi:uncharacterized protein (DUF934 family)